MRARHGIKEGDAELRQRLVPHIAAALLWEDKEPDAPAVEALATQLRRELWDGATTASAALGDAPPFVSPREAELRMHCHDVQHPHHDKDFRCIAVFRLRALSKTTVR
eukprot:8074019-Pyramimonas_sp.AAC.1